MEATAGILRGHLESWRSSPVRWFLERVGQIARISDASSPTPVVQDRWQEMFWTEPTRSRGTAARSRSALFEQAELWDARPAAAARPVAPAPVEPARVEAPVVARTESVARMKPAVRSAARRAPVSATYAERGRRVRTEDIARYLQVNNAVYGRLAPVSDLSLPRRSFSAELNLWKGSELGTPFVTGC